MPHSLGFVVRVLRKNKVHLTNPKVHPAESARVKAWVPVLAGSSFPLGLGSHGIALMCVGPSALSRLARCGFALGVCQPQNPRLETTRMRHPREGDTHTERERCIVVRAKRNSSRQTCKCASSLNEGNKEKRSSQHRSGLDSNGATKARQEKR